MAATFLIWGIGLLLVFRSEAGRYLESRFARPIDFRIRDTLGYSPAISDKLKIFSIDDRTFAQLGSWVLSMDDWAQLITTIAANEPRAILIDGMFSKADGLTGDVTKALQGLKDLKVPLIIGSFVKPERIRFREFLDLSHPDYSLSGLVGKPHPLASDLLPPIVDNRDWYAYGPSLEMRQVVSHVGHLNYGSVSGVVAPLIRLADDTVLGHISFYLGNKREIVNGKIRLDGVTVPVDAEGNVTVNFPTTETFYNASLSMKGLLSLARQGAPSKVVEKGDIVLILPLMYTGNTDFKQTPFGSLELSTEPPRISSGRRCCCRSLVAS